jgi:hypothetical protein
MRKYLFFIVILFCFSRIFTADLSNLHQYNCRNTKCADIITKATALGCTGLADTARGTILFFGDNAAKARILNILQSFDVPPVQISGRLRTRKTGNQSTRQNEINARRIQIQKSEAQYSHTEEMEFKTMSGSPFRMSLSEDIIQQIADFYYIENRGLTVELTFYPLEQSVESEIKVRTALNNSPEQLHFQSRLQLTPGEWRQLILHRDEQQTQGQNRQLDSHKKKRNITIQGTQTQQSQYCNIGVEILIDWQ